MNALHQAQSAYRNHDQPIRTSRGIEYEAFARITHRLKEAASDPPKISDLASAIHDNRRLWSILASDVVDEANALPQELRARIFYLSEFARTYSSRVLNGASPAPLIDINMAVMRGLRQGQAAKPANHDLSPRNKEPMT